MDSAVLLCQSDGSGGRLSGVVVGFDSDTYSTETDLAELDGSLVDLRVTVTDDGGNTATVTRSVEIVYGN